MKSLSTILRDEREDFDKRFLGQNGWYEPHPIKEWLTTHDSKIISTICEEIEQKIKMIVHDQDIEAGLKWLRNKRDFDSMHAYSKAVGMYEILQNLKSLIHNSNI